jgi:glutathione S-transferase
MEPTTANTLNSNPTPQEPLSPPGIPTLHHLTSSQSLRILWALEELAAANPAFTYNLKTYTRIQARAPKELQSIHPLGLSPILVIDPPPGGSPDDRIVITESRLILQHLADSYSNGIWEPTNDKDRRRDAYFQEFANASLGPKVASVLQFDFIPGRVPFLIRPLASLVFNGLAGVIRKDLARPFQLMEDALAEPGRLHQGREWFSGERIGLADFCLSWPMDEAEQRGYFDGSKYPRVAGWLSRVHERKAYLEARVKGGSYDLVTFDWK